MRVRSLLAVTIIVAPTIASAQSDPRSWLPTDPEDPYLEFEYLRLHAQAAADESAELDAQTWRESFEATLDDQELADLMYITEPICGPTVCVMELPVEYRTEVTSYASMLHRVAWLGPDVILSEPDYIFYAKARPGHALFERDDAVLRELRGQE